MSRSCTVTWKYVWSGVRVVKEGCRGRNWKREVRKAVLEVAGREWRDEVVRKVDLEVIDCNSKS